MSAASGGIERGTPAYRRLSSALLAAGFATFALLYSAQPLLHSAQPLLPRFTVEFGISAAAASLAVSLATGPMAVAILFAAVVSDRIGRGGIMRASLGVAAVLTIAAAFVPGWTTLLAVRALTGLALAGIPAVAMAFIAEEVDAASIGAAMGLYIAGSAIGGMAGRLGVSFLSELFGWRVAVGVTGAVAALAASVFAATLPPSRRFVPVRHDFASWRRSLGRIFADPALPLLYAAAFLLMGIFVTVYNYAGFRLLAPPYSLSPTEVGAIFLLYIVGSFSASWVGGSAGTYGRRRIFWMPVAVLLAGVALTAARPLALIILGIAVVTAGFFGAHSIASSWVGRRARANRGQAAALYLFFYYLGSSVLGSAGGLAWSRAGWPGVAGFCAVLAVATLVVAARLALVPPLPENRAAGPALPA